MTVCLRVIRVEDLELLFAWRQDREIMRFLTAAPERPTWEEHMAWFQSRQYRLDWIIELSEDGLTRDVGTVHYQIDWQTNTGEIGLIVGEKTLWGKGVGRAALEQAMEEPRVRGVWAQIHMENTRSQRLFGGLGFKREVGHVDNRLSSGHERWVLR